MAKSFKYKNESYLDSTGIVHNKKILSGILDDSLLMDVTDKFSFRGTYTGKVYKIGKIVIMQIYLFANATAGWGILGTVPEELYPYEVYDNGAPIAGTGAWIYGRNGTPTVGVIRGASTAGEPFILCGTYITE